jgi:3-(3-hydroxy-phenyl)propionate hydroxylase
MAMRRDKVPDKIIVIGGGPVGAMAALMLAQAGVPALLLEAEAGAVIDYRASTFHPPTLELLEPTGATDALLAMGLQAPTMQYRDRTLGKIAEFDLALLRNDTAYPFRLQCEQFKLVDWAYRALAATPAASLRFRHRVVGLTQDDDRVTVTAETPDGPVALTADYAIACDGGRSFVRKQLGIDFPGWTHPESFLVSGVRFDFRAAMPDLCSVNYTADPDEWYFLLQIPDLWRVVMPVAQTVDAVDAASDAYIQRTLHGLLPRAEPYEIAVRAIYRVSQRVAETYRRGRVFLAGDAAHINNPLGGMGLNGGLHDAIDLTRRLADVWHGRADARTLDGYEPRRKPEAVNAINAVTERNKRLLEERDPEIRARNLADWRRMAADPALAYQHLLQTSMIASLRRAGMLPARS